MGAEFSSDVLKIALILVPVHFCVIAFGAWKLSQKSGKSFWMIFYYGSVAWQMDPRQRPIGSHPVYKNNILSEVNYVQGLHIKGLLVNFSALILLAAYFLFRSS